MSTRLITFGFKGRNLAAVDYARRHSATLVTGLSKSVKDTLRGLVVQSINQGVSVLDLATQIREVVGLNARQARAAVNYRKALVKQGISPQRIRLQMERYTAQKIRQRAITIARYEVMNALNGAKLEEALERQRSGDIGKGARKQVVVTHSTAKPPCEICVAAARKKYKLSEVITEGRKHPPFHPRCRCTLTVIE